MRSVRDYFGFGSPYLLQQQLWMKGHKVPLNSIKNWKRRLPSQAVRSMVVNSLRLTETEHGTWIANCGVRSKLPVLMDDLYVAQRVEIEPIVELSKRLDIPIEKHERPEWVNVINEVLNKRMEAIFKAGFEAGRNKRIVEE